MIVSQHRNCTTRHYTQVLPLRTSNMIYAWQASAARLHGGAGFPPAMATAAPSARQPTSKQCAFMGQIIMGRICSMIIVASLLNLDVSKCGVASVCMIVFTHMREKERAREREREREFWRRRASRPGKTATLDHFWGLPIQRVWLSIASYCCSCFFSCHNRVSTLSILRPETNTQSKPLGLQWVLFVIALLRLLGIWRLWGTVGENNKAPPLPPHPQGQSEQPHAELHATLHYFCKSVA